MEIGRVVGQVVSTVRDPGLPNVALLLVDIVDGEGNVKLSGQVAADTLGAGTGECVLMVRGSTARLIVDLKAPVDLSIVGIIDQITANQKTLYSK